MSTLMQRLMAKKFAKSKPTAQEAKAPGWRAERSAAIAEGQRRRNAPQPFEKKREQWRAEALAKMEAPRPTLEQAVEQANVELGRDADAFKLIDRTMDLLKGAPPAPVPTSAPSTARGSCKAINPVTGRQCALLSGHTKPHRHGSTEFHLAAVPGQRITRREELERFASATHSSPFTGG